MTLAPVRMPAMTGVQNALRKLKSQIENLRTTEVHFTKVHAATTVTHNGATFNVAQIYTDGMGVSPTSSTNLATGQPGPGKTTGTVTTSVTPTLARWIVPYTGTGANGPQPGDLAIALKIGTDRRQKQQTILLGKLA